MPRYQVGLTKDDSSSRHSEWRQPSTDDVRKSKLGPRYFTAFGVDLSPDNMAVAIVYFVQGVLGLARLAVSFYLKDDLHLDPAETAVVSGFSSLPWLIKPLYGFISDSIPLFGYRRRSYLFLSGLLGALSWSLMATVVSSKYSAASSSSWLTFCCLLRCCKCKPNILLSSYLVLSFMPMINNIRSCLTFIQLLEIIEVMVVDSMVVERARGESQSTSGSLQSLCWGSSAFGGIVSAYFSGSLVDTYGVRFVFGVTAFLPLMTSAVAVLVNEDRISSGERTTLHSGSGFVESSKQHVRQLWTSVKQPNICCRPCFIISWQATPQSDSAMFFFISATDNSGSADLSCEMLPILRKMLTYFEERSLNASFMPVLVLAAKLCPPGMEATLFATLMSISNAGSVTGGLVGAGLTRIWGHQGHFGNLL
ncbi:hypothetical protein Zm00014a_035751 [Zea mays]|uniref:Folate-biopterin transporter 1, chloroplastic n=1 Tax=Zea mays TaxID=4577 RepID=A0A3L6FUI4_MAIZE|nr:Folate-biopterin transporter 1, chloroplastic [Zea mays]PWZ38522.1 hypothetical protein Zm00014a_035751 [Zea mays]